MPSEKERIAIERVTERAQESAHTFGPEGKLLIHVCRVLVMLVRRVDELKHAESIRREREDRYL